MGDRHGALTEPIAAALGELAAPMPGWRVYHDHAGAGRQRVWAHLGKEPRTVDNLSAVDVLLASVPEQQALLVLEVEETGCPPKTLLGDILGVALADNISLAGGSQRFAVTPETELWVCYVADPRGQQSKRNDRLLARLQAAWGEAPPLGCIRLVPADSREDLVETVAGALRAWFEARSQGSCVEKE